MKEKKDILLDECQEERRTKAAKEDNEITMRNTSAADESLCITTQVHKYECAEEN